MDYLQQCKKLSLTARMAIALVVFERYCKNHNIEGKLISEFLDHLWKWPLIDGPDQFEPWEKTRPELVNYGLGDEANSELLSILNEANVEEFAFRDIVTSIVEILWGNFWGGSEDEPSMQAFHTVINRSKVSPLPCLTPFKFSLFRDGSGWGEKLSIEDCSYWRGSV